MGNGASGPPFLASHRAQAVCARELSRLSDLLVAAARTVARDADVEPPVARVAPDRCIVQLGPVALTVTWLRAGNDLATGQLLSIVWLGVIAARGDHTPERLGARLVPPTPLVTWEQTFQPSADSEASWRWHPRGDDVAGARRAGDTEGGYSSPELASHCIEQLRSALEAASAPSSADESGD